MVVISAYFSGSETGMMTLNRYRLRHMAKQGNRSAKRVEKLLRKPDRLISLVLIGNNLVNILASALGTIVGMRLYGDAGVAIATGVLTFVVLVFAEVLPKTIAALYPEKVAYPSSFLLAPLQILMMPLVWLLNAITRMLMRMMGIKTDIVVSGSLSKEELRTIVHESRSQISRRNQDMLLSVLDLEKMTVDDIMVPRSEIIGIDINDDWKSILRQLSHSPHGRIVLYRDSLDDAISMLRVREAWRLMSEKKEFTKETMPARRGRDLFCPGGYAAQHTVGEVSAQQKESRPGRQRVWRHSGAGDGRRYSRRDCRRFHHVDVANTCRRGHAAKRRVGDYRWHRQRARN